MHIDKLPIQSWDNLAAQYAEKFMDLELYNDTYDTFCLLLNKPNASILELGCGPGNITRYLLAKRPDFNITATDLAPNMVKLAKANNPSANCVVLDCKNISSLPTPFDGIVCGFCMPYLSKDECLKLIKDCASQLNNNGLLYFSTIEGDYSQSGYQSNSSRTDKMFVYFHEAGYLKKVLMDNNFVIENIIRKNYPKPDGIVDTHLIVIARKAD